jgi:hypothetical protein
VTGTRNAVSGLPVKKGITFLCTGNIAPLQPGDARTAVARKGVSSPGVAVWFEIFLTLFSLFSRANLENFPSLFSNFLPFITRGNQ